jgi:hypothetical protein
VKKVFERALKAKQAQRKKGAARSPAEKFKLLDRLRERSAVLRGAKRTGLNSRAK